MATEAADLRFSEDLLSAGRTLLRQPRILLATTQEYAREHEQDRAGEETDEGDADRECGAPRRGTRAGEDVGLPPREGHGEEAGCDGEREHRQAERQEHPAEYPSHSPSSGEEPSEADDHRQEAKGKPAVVGALAVHRARVEEGAGDKGQVKGADDEGDYQAANEGQ